MKLAIKKGTTSKILTVFIQNSSSTTGAGLTGLAYNTGSLTAYYYREGAGSATAITLVTATAGTFTSSGFVVVDGTNLPGVYELHIPNAAIASGADSVVVMLKGAANMAPLVLEIQLTAVDLADGVRGGMTALPNATPGGSGGLIVLGNSGNTARLDLTAGMIVSQSTTNAPGLSIAGNGSGQGVLIAAGNAAAGLHITTDSGSGVLISAATSGHGIEVTGYGSGKSAIKLQGASSGVAEIAGNLAGTIAGLTAAGWATAFSVDSGTTFASAVAGSVVKEIADNASGSGLDAAGVRSAIGLASANLDTQLAAIDDAVDTEVGAIKTVTDKLDDTLTDSGGGAYIFTTASLVNAPTGGSAPSAATIASAVRTELTTELGRVDVAISTRLAPTTSGRTLDVTATGAAGIDWSNVEAPTTTLDLSGTTVAAVTGAVGSVTGAVGSVTGLTAADVGAIKAKTDNLPSDPADASVVAGLIAALPSAADTAAAVKAATVDGITIESLLEAVLAVVSGQATVSGSTVSFKLRDGTTTKMAITYGGTPGQRTGSTLS